MKRSILPFIVLLICSGFANNVIARTHTVEQINKKFMRDGSKIVSIDIKVGDTVKFENNDRLFHNIYSVSKIKKFNLGAYGSGKSRSILFDKSGNINVACAIHPRMMLKVIVE